MPGTGEVMPADGAPRKAVGYDVFISYARGDSGWVKRNLYEPLSRCLGPEGRAPRVFLDVDKEGIPPAVDFMVYLAEAIAGSRTVVAVYSPAYFASEMCLYELTMAARADPMGQRGKLTPILLDAAAEQSVPLHVSGINYIPVARDDWFEVLCRSVGLEPPEAPTQLVFLDQPADSAVHHTLPPIRVATAAEGSRPDAGRAVTLTLEGGWLHGSTSVPTEGGTAVFDDLTIATPLETTRLVANASGCLPAFSEPFSVREAPAPRATRAEAIIPERGEPVFFDDDRAVALFGPSGIAVYDLDGSLLARIDPCERPRLLRRHGGAIAVATWSGRVVWIASDGRHADWDLRAGDAAYTVPGDLQLDGSGVLVGLWSGRIVRLDPAAGAQPLADHPSGVQALAARDDRLFICGLDGGLGVYRADRLVRSAPLEPRVHLFELRDDGLLVVGEERLYRVPLDGAQIFKVDLKLDGVAAVLAGLEWPLVMDRRGRAILFDAELSVRASFHGAAGARPLSASRSGGFCVLANPDGSRALVELGSQSAAQTDPAGGPLHGTMVFNWSAGPLAVSLSGRHFAAGGEDGTRILAAAEMDRLVREREGA